MGGVNIEQRLKGQACEAGLRWQRYRQAGGSRSRIISDFSLALTPLLRPTPSSPATAAGYATCFPELQGP